MPRMARTLWLGALTLVASGCGLLDTTKPNIIDPAELNTPEGAEARRLGAISDFTFAKDGDGNLNSEATDGQIMISGLIADEFVLSTTPPTQQEIDQRIIFASTNGTLSAYYFYLHKARAAAEDAAERLQTYGLDPDNNGGIPEMLALAGFTYVYFGEGFCSAVPYSHLAGDQILYGPSITDSATFELAIERFDSALAHPAVGADPAIEPLARLGEARALLNLGRFAAAASMASSVPDGFVYVTEHASSPLTLNNAIYQLTNNKLFSVSNLEGGNGLAYLDVNDPRIPYVADDNGLDGSTPQYNLLKYSSTSADVPVADWIEARLIQAEALLQPPASADFAGMTAILNNLRQNAISPALPDLLVPATYAAARDLLFSERAYWLFATGHRHGDMRRLVRQYGLSADNVFPTGTYVKGGQYGTDVNLPVPFDEDANPNFNRIQCDTQQP